MAVPESDLPVGLPPMDDFRPATSDDPDAPVRPPLARAQAAWREVERDGIRYERELNTMPQWAGSCWYYLRFLDPKNAERFVDPEAERYWMRGADDESGQGVDLYVGGVEHAVLHLLYARFWHRVLFDLGYVSTREPFGRLYNRGYILAPSYKDARGIHVPAAEVEERDGEYFHRGRRVTRELGKMGKSLKNSITPDDICERYGADTLRLYEMYLGPIHKPEEWSTHDIVGVHRFLQRLWRNLVDGQSSDLLVVDEPAPDAIRRHLHRTIKAVSEDMEGLEFNTAIAALIELNNALVKHGSVAREVAEPLVLMLAPLAPHVAEEFWSRLGHEQSLAYHPWPAWDEALVTEDEIELPVQLNGKTRGKVTVPASADQPTIEAAIKADPRFATLLEGKAIRRVILVPGRLINIVVS